MAVSPTAGWHGLEKQIDSAATFQRALPAANLDWNVVKKPPLAFDGKMSHPNAGRFAIVREDCFGKARPIVGIVGSNYTPTRNRDAFEFFDEIVASQPKEAGAIYDTAGCPGGR